MKIKWTDAAIEAALTQLKASRFSTGMSHKECMEQVLYAASTTQFRDESESEPPPVFDKKTGLKVGDWIKEDGKWEFYPICYD